MGAGTTRDVAVTGQRGVPADADGVVLNVTATGGTIGLVVPVRLAAGLGPADRLEPELDGRQTIPNAVTVELPADGELSIYNYMGTPTWSST